MMVSLTDLVTIADVIITIIAIIIAAFVTWLLVRSSLEACVPAVSTRVAMLGGSLERHAIYSTIQTLISLISHYSGHGGIDTLVKKYLQNNLHFHLKFECVNLDVGDLLLGNKIISCFQAILFFKCSWEHTRGSVSP